MAAQLRLVSNSRVSRGYGSSSARPQPLVKTLQNRVDKLEQIVFDIDQAFDVSTDYLESAYSRIGELERKLNQVNKQLDKACSVTDNFDIIVNSQEQLIRHLTYRFTYFVHKYHDRLSVVEKSLPVHSSPYVSFASSTASSEESINSNDTIKAIIPFQRLRRHTH